MIWRSRIRQWVVAAIVISFAGGMFWMALKYAESTGVSVSELEAQMAGRTLVRKIITAEEVAWVVTFLASPRSISITGDAIVVGGGLPGAVHY